MQSYTGNGDEGDDSPAMAVARGYQNPMRDCCPHCAICICDTGLKPSKHSREWCPCLGLSRPQSCERASALIVRVRSEMCCAVVRQRFQRQDDKEVESLQVRVPRRWGACGEHERRGERAESQWNGSQRVQEYPPRGVHQHLDTAHVSRPQRANTRSSVANAPRM